MNNLKMVVILALLLVLLVSCTKKEEAATAGLDQSGKTVMTVGQLKITDKQLDNEMAKLPPNIRSVFTGKEGIRKLVDEIRKREILFLQAKASGLDKEKEYIEKVEDFKKINLINALITKNISADEISVKPEDAQKYYDDHIAEFERPEQVRASHILVDTEQEAKALYEKLATNPGDFEATAKTASKDKLTSERGGDLGYISAGQMDPVFDKAALALGVNKISEPVKTPLGFHIIKVVEKKPSEKIPFESVRGMIVQHVTGEKQKASFDKYFATIEKTFPVNIDDAVVNEYAAKQQAASAMPPTAPEPEAAKPPTQATP